MSGTIKLRRSSLCVAKLSDYSTACQIAQHTTILRSAGATTGAFSFVPSAPVITLPHIRSASWDAPPLGGSVSPKLSSWYTTGRAREKYAIRCTSKIRRRWRRLWNTCEMYINSHPGMHKVQCASSPILDNARFDYVSHSHLAKTS